MIFQQYFEFIEFDKKEWGCIESALTNTTFTSSNIKYIIYNFQKFLWPIQGDCSILSQVDLQEFTDLFNWSIPHILDLPKLFPNGLSQHYNSSEIKLDKYKCLCLLSALFFSCTRRCHLFLSKYSPAKYECFISYFKTMRLIPKEELLSEYLTIYRSSLENRLSINSWKKCNLPLKKLIKESSSKIEDLNDDTLKVDFANMYIGGGVLGTGCVQEEIIFSIYPEMIVSMLFCRKMRDNEAIVINGARRIASYTGYGFEFRFKEIYQNIQNPSLNTWVAIDALMMVPLKDQFSEQNLCRELNKAFIGFFKNHFDQEMKPVVTGKWGCGEFKGFAPLKTLIMWIAASAAGRDMIMTTFGDIELEVLDKIGEKYEGTPICEMVEKILNNPGKKLLSKLLSQKKKRLSKI